MVAEASSTYSSGASSDSKSNSYNPSGTYVWVDSAIRTSSTGKQDKVTGYYVSGKEAAILDQKYDRIKEAQSSKDLNGLKAASQDYTSFIDSIKNSKEIRSVPDNEGISSGRAYDPSNIKWSERPKESEYSSPGIFGWFGGLIGRKHPEQRQAMREASDDPLVKKTVADLQADYESGKKEVPPQFAKAMDSYKAGKNEELQRVIEKTAENYISGGQAESTAKIEPLGRLERKSIPLEEAATYRGQETQEQLDQRINQILGPENWSGADAKNYNRQLREGNISDKGPRISKTESGYGRPNIDERHISREIEEVMKEHAEGAKSVVALNGRSDVNYALGAGNSNIALEGRPEQKAISSGRPQFELPSGEAYALNGEVSQAALLGVVRQAALPPGYSPLSLPAGRESAALGSGYRTAFGSEVSKPELGSGSARKEYKGKTPEDLQREIESSAQTPDYDNLGRNRIENWRKEYQLGLPAGTTKPQKGSPLREGGPDYQITEDIGSGLDRIGRGEEYKSGSNDEGTLIERRKIGGPQYEINEDVGAGIDRIAQGKEYELIKEETPQMPQPGPTPATENYSLLIQNVQNYRSDLARSKKEMEQIFYPTTGESSKEAKDEEYLRKEEEIRKRYGLSEEDVEFANDAEMLAGLYKVREEQKKSGYSVGSGLEDQIAHYENELREFDTSSNKRGENYISLLKGGQSGEFIKGEGDRYHINSDDSVTKTRISGSEMIKDAKKDWDASGDTFEKQKREYSSEAHYTKNPVTSSSGSFAEIDTQGNLQDSRGREKGMRDNDRWKGYESEWSEKVGPDIDRLSELKERILTSSNADKPKIDAQYASIAKRIVDTQTGLRQSYGYGSERADLLETWLDRRRARLQESQSAGESNQTGTVNNQAAPDAATA